MSSRSRLCERAVQVAAVGVVAAALIDGAPALAQSADLAGGTTAPSSSNDDAAWRKKIEQRLEQLERENADLRAQASAEAAARAQDIAATREAIRKDVASHGGGLTLEPRPEQTTPDFFDVNKYAALGDFPGSIRLPGTNVSLQIGGFAQLDMLMDFDRLGSRDSFITRTIPTTGEGVGDTNFSVRQTRLFVKTATPTNWGTLTTYIETDFFGSDNNAELRLRHAYGEIGDKQRLLGGQTWSAFVDASAFPATLDQQGAAGQMLTRRPQLRYTVMMPDDLTWAIALEDPNPDFSNAAGTEGEGVARFPALTSNLRWKGNWGHLQAAGLVRELTFDPDEGHSSNVVGWGLNFTGQVNVFETDKIQFQLAGGNAIADYMNDTGGAGLDGFYNGRNLKGLATLGAVLGYQHWWNKKWDSNFIYSYAWIENDTEQPNDAYHSAQYIAANLRWHPAERVMLGMELLYGIREDNDDNTGDALRLQFSAQYKF